MTFALTAIYRWEYSDTLTSYAIRLYRAFRTLIVW